MTTSPQRFLVVLSSPRPKGNTAVLAERLTAGAQAAGAEIKTVSLADLAISPCSSCYACRQPDWPGCVIEDDMQPLYDEIKAAQVLVLVSPVYWFTLSAQIKAFIDRWFAINDPEGRPFAGKKVALLMAYGDATPQAAGYFNAENTVKDICAYLGMDFAGAVHASAYDEGDILQKPEALAQAEALGRRLAQG